RVVHKDGRTTQIGTKGRDTAAAAIKVDAGNRIESHRDAFDRREPRVQTGRVRELVSALRIAVKEVIVAPGKANSNGIQEGWTENMSLRNRRQHITADLKNGERF